jgi:metal-dependent amidase/aminoacylase/carboxypeptidase family protein
MEKRGWEVTRHYKMETAWRAAFTHKSRNVNGESRTGRVLGVNSEMDALPVCEPQLLVAGDHLHIWIGHWTRMWTQPDRSGWCRCRLGCPQGSREA